MTIDLALARYLDATGVVDFDETGVSGNTFLGHMPSTPDAAIMFKVTGGLSLDNAGSGYDEPSIQVMTRGEVYDRQGPLDRILDIYSALAGLHAVTLDEGGTAETYVVRVLALQSYPADLGMDDNERWEWSQNYTFHIRSRTLHRI